MDGDKIDGAGRASDEELFEPGETGVGDGGGGELGAAGEGLKVSFVAGGGGGGAEVGLRAQVGFVEGQEVFGARGDGGGGGGLPVGGVLGLRAPEHGDVFEGAGEAGGRGAPVVGPGDLAGLVEAGGEGGGVVG